MQAIKELFKQLAGIWKELGLNQKITVSATTLAVIAGVVSRFWSGVGERSIHCFTVISIRSKLVK